MAVNNAEVSKNSPEISMNTRCAASLPEATCVLEVERLKDKLHDLRIVVACTRTDI